MGNEEELYNHLEKIDGRSYKAYKDLAHKVYDFGNFQLSIPYVQGDPFASPSKVFLRLEQSKSNFPEYYLENNIRRQAVEDFLNRHIAKMVKRYVKGRRGSGKSGIVYIANTGQEVIERSSVEFNRDFIEARLYVGLPAKGRRVLGFQAKEIFSEELSIIAKSSLYYDELDKDALEEHVKTVEDQEYLSKLLKEKGLCSFVANGSILPRISGVDDRPMESSDLVSFISPEEYQVEFDLPYKGKIVGMAIPEGITLIVGGGYHGKSTLLNAIELGVYKHIPGDGREYVVTREDAIKIRAEDGRRVEKVNISPFINNLPQGISTRTFSTENASGSTSQAANIMEALELGSSILLIDEDTCATNFMIRDARMQKLVSNEKEPITPFIDKASALYNQHGVSTILVIGGAGDYFDIADQVIMMDEYRPVAVTDRVKDIARELPSQRARIEFDDFGTISHRYPDEESINPRRKNRLKVSARGKDTISFGYYDIKLNYLEQLVSQEQTKAIADIIVFALKNGILKKENTLLSSLNKVYKMIEDEGLELISPYSNPEGDYVKPRLFEVGAAINRLRSLTISKVD
ncbi:MAG: ABC-ATPase domain-containing protein [bacterium]